MNILYDSQIFVSQRYGGISRYFVELASRVRAFDGAKALVLAPGHMNSLLAEKRGVHLIGWKTPAWAAKIRGGRRIERYVGTAVESTVRALWKGDVLHETYYTEVPKKIGRAARVVTVYDMIHELFADQFDPADPTARAKQAAVERSDLVICISESTRRDLIGLLNVSPDKIVVTHLSASLSVAEGAARVGGRPYVLYVGDRGRYKNFAALVDAMQASPTLRELRLLCFGGGPFSDQEKSRLTASGFPLPQVEQRFGGDDELARLYRDASCFVYPSHYEGFGIPPLEAMICGCPVACSDKSSIPEVAGDAAAYFDPYDIASIATAVESVVTSDSYRAELVARGTRRAALFSWDRCAKETLAAYRKVAAG